VPRRAVRTTFRVLPVLAVLVGIGAAADEVTVPVRLDTAFLRRGLVEQVFTEPGEKAAVWRDGAGCGRLDLFEPVVDVKDARLRVTSRGEARVGVPLGDHCIFSVSWQGFVEVLEEPGLDADARALTFRVVDSNVYDEKHEKRFTTGAVWDLVKAHVHPRLAVFRIDLTRPFTELRAWLPTILPGSEAQVDRLLASLAVRDPRAVEDAVVVSFAFTVEPHAPPPVPEPALSDAELAAWEARLDRWDAFLTFVVKHLARDVPVELRGALADLLLDSRYELLAALAPPAAGAPDPVPALFVRAWTRLAPVLRRAAPGLPAETALQYVGFIAAGDALAALGQLGPGIGLDVSADGLRRLARIAAPASTEDPVAYGTEVDPELRALLGLGPPLPPPDISPDVDLDPLSWLASPAWAGVDHETIARLNRWAPSREDLTEYLPLVRALLDDVAEQANDTLDAAYRPVYRNLVVATAWQESCWRQFIRRNGKLVTLRSPVGSVGIMQVNQRVWRGAYDLKGLLGDIAYNARAGAEILRHYLVDYAIAHGEHEKLGGPDNLPRATYAVYNGGPGHLARYRAKTARRGLARIDRAFWEKYGAVRAGREMDVAACFGE
jgi:transglycosylase-like protein with SLT domain